MDFSAKDFQRGDGIRSSQNDNAPPNILDFVFGNVNSSLQLEGNELLDDDAKRMLPNLSRHVSETVTQMINPTDLQQQNLSDGDRAKLRSTAEDYYAIEETVPAVETTTFHTSVSGYRTISAPIASSSTDLPRHGLYKPPNYADGKPSRSLPPPHSLPARLSLPQAVDDITSDKPLASLLPVEMMDVDVRDVYPDFSEDKPLRWNRLFRSQIEPRFLPPEPTAPKISPSENNKEYRLLRNDGGADLMPVARDSSGYTFEEILADLERPWCPLSSNSLKPEASGPKDNADSEFNSDGSRSELGVDDYSWRHGAAECWYDKAGVSETGREYFDRSRHKPVQVTTTAAVQTPDAPQSVVDELDDDEMAGEDEQITNDANTAKNYLKPFNLSELNPDHEGPWLTGYLYEWEKDIVTDIDGIDTDLTSAAGGGKTGGADRQQSVTQRQWQIHVQRMRNMPWTSTYMMARVMHARKMQIEQQRTGVTNVNAVRDPHIDAILARYTDEELMYFQKMAVSQKSMINEVEWEKDVLKFVQEGVLPPPEPPLFFIRDFRTTLFKADESKLYKSSEWKELQRKREDSCEYVNTVTPANKDIALAMDAAAAGEAQSNVRASKMPSQRGFAATQHFKAVLQLGRQDFLNVSKDAEYYRSSVKHQAGTSAVTKSALKISALSATHSIPAMQLYPRFYPPNWTRERLRHFHRMQLRLPARGNIPRASKPNTPHRFEVVTKYEIRAEQRRQKLLAKLGGGTVMHMRQPHDLSAKDSELLLFEYSEEFPPLVLQPGMAANILNYARYPSTPAAYNPKLGDKYEYGTLAYCKKSPFLGHIGHGQAVQTIESSVFRAPIYQHDMPTTDFLVIRNKKKYFIRRVARIFCVGQECPLVEVPSPKSKRAVAIHHNHIQSRILRLFAKSGAQPPRLDFAELERMFPAPEAGLLRKKLRALAKQEKQGKTSTWILNKDYKLPQEEEIRELCRPDDYCALYSMRCAEQRLRDAGYGEAMEKLLLLDDEVAGEKSLEEKTDDEIKAAPWNTTRAFLSAMQGKCMLEVQGAADPTGCGEGISYTRLRTKGREKGTTRAEAAARRQRKVLMAQNRSMVSGTQADLRKLTLQEARTMLQNHGFKKDTIWGMTRWQAIHLIRHVGISEARAGQGGAFAKFSRGPKKSIQELMIKFRNDCQKVFTVQHQTLSATAADSLSDDESDDAGEDGTAKDKEDGAAAGITSVSAGEIDWQAFALQLESSMAQRGKSKHQIEHEIEEKERRLLKQLLTETSEAAKKQAVGNGTEEAGAGAASAPAAAPTALATSSSVSNLSKLSTDSKAKLQQQNRKLEIRRTYVDPDTNQPYSRTEVVKDAAIIDLYMKIRSSKAKSLLQRLLGVNENTRGTGITAAQARIRRNEAGTSSGAQLGGGADAQASDSIDGAPNGLKEAPRRGRRPLAESEKEIRKFKKEHLQRDRDREREKNKSVQCSACSQFGHMKSNRICPRFDETYGHGASLRKGRPGAFDEDDLDMDADDYADENSAGYSTLIGGDAENASRGDTGATAGAKAAATDADGLPITNNEQPAVATAAETTKTADQGGVRVEGTKLVFTKKLVESAQEDLQKQQQLRREEDEKQRLLREDLNLSDDEDSDADFNDDDADVKVSNKRRKLDADYRPPPHANVQGTGAATSESSGGLILKIRRDSLMFNPTEDAAAGSSAGPPGEHVQSPSGDFLSPLTSSDGGAGTPTAAGGGSVGSGGERRPLVRGSRRGGRGSVNNNDESGESARGRLSGNKRGRPESPSDLYSRPAKQVHQRWRTDPFVFINSRLDTVLKELRAMKQAGLFLLPVRDVEFPDYRTHVLHPMDLNTMRLKVKRGAEPGTSVADENDERLTPGNVYRSRAEFLADLQQIVRNSELYNGPANEITSNAWHLVAVAQARLYENEKVSEELATEERRIDPLVDPDAEPVRCLNQFLQQVIEQTMRIDTTQQKIFCKPVSLKLLPDYAVKVARPIDLSVILDLCKRRNYTRLDQFRADVELIRFNSQTYNGDEHPVTRIASKLVDYALTKMDARKEVLQHFESRIIEQEEIRANEAAELAAAVAADTADAAIAADAGDNFADEVFSPPPTDEASRAAANVMQKPAVSQETTGGAVGILEDLELSDEEDDDDVPDNDAGRQARGPVSPANLDRLTSPFAGAAPADDDDNRLGDEEDDERSSAARMMMMDIDDESVLARWRSDEGGADQDQYDADDTAASPTGRDDANALARSRIIDQNSGRQAFGGMSKPSSERIATYDDSEPASPATFAEINAATASRNARALGESIGLPLPPMPSFGLRTNRRVVDDHDYDDDEDEFIVAPEDRLQPLQHRSIFADDDEVDERMFEQNDGDDMMPPSSLHNTYTGMPSSPPLMMRSTVAGTGSGIPVSPAGDASQASTGEQLSDDDETSSANFSTGDKPASPPTSATAALRNVTRNTTGEVEGDDVDEFGDLLTFDSAARIAGYAADEDMEQIPIASGSNSVPAMAPEQKDKEETLSESSDEDEL